ncbi:MAG TPA: thioredoxin family protein [Lapillicoccus sp.]
MTEATAPARHRPEVGDRLSGFTLPDPSERIVAIDPHDSAATVVVFTSSGCPYALAWHDRIQDLARDYEARGVRTVQVVSNDESTQPADSTDALQRRAAVGDFRSVVLRDAGQSVAAAFGATATPEVFVLDRDGVVRYHGAPDENHDEPALSARWVRDALDAVLDGRSVSLPSTSAAGCSIKWRVELLWSDGCPTHDDAAVLLEETLSAMEREDVVVRAVRVATRADADTRSFPGSPTFQVGGLDLFPADVAPSLGCRVYHRPDDRISPLPAQEELETRLREALARPWDLPGWTDFRSRRPRATSASH